MVLLLRLCRETTERDYCCSEKILGMWYARCKD